MTFPEVSDDDACPCWQRQCNELENQITCRGGEAKNEQFKARLKTEWNKALVLHKFEGRLRCWIYFNQASSTLYHEGIKKRIPKYLKLQIESERFPFYLSISVHQSKSSATSLSETWTGKIRSFVCLIELAFVVTVWTLVNWNTISS